MLKQNKTKHKKTNKMTKKKKDERRSKSEKVEAEVDLIDRD